MKSRSTLERQGFPPMYGGTHAVPYDKRIRLGERFRQSAGPLHRPQSRPGAGDAGAEFLLAMLPLLKSTGEMHWYDFAADHELSRCDRTRQTLQSACQSLGYRMEVIHVSKVGSVAKRQFRVCVDIRITR